ncbi:tol-pal system protein YbgF [Thiosocius teredinicola]|uniref:tol-pal system protein YbgF n=1 Tax=Thiosocius teredinicola TaxID=1973002 RepID=UPI000990BA5B
MRTISGLLIGLIGLLPAATLAASLSTSQRLELLERRVDRITELTLKLDAMERENRQLRGDIENLQYELQQLERKQRDLYLDIDQRLSGGQGGNQGGAMGPGTPPTNPTAPPPQTGGNYAAPQTPSSPSNADPSAIQAEYQAAYALLSPQQKRYREAAQAFTTFLQRYPNDDLAPNAQYWLGEAHYVSQNNREALAAFEQVVQRYPTSNKVPGALFKMGRLQQVLGRRSDAIESYRRVVRDHPNSSAAGLAQDQLKKLGG